MDNSVSKSVRAIEDVRSVIKHAKLDEADLKTDTIALFFSDSLIDKDVKLMEISPDILSSLEQGENLVIKGLEADEAVVCTYDKTFEIKDAGTSNSLLVLPSFDSASPISEDGNRTVKHLPILGIYHTYFELRTTRPRFKRLRTLLTEHPYNGIDNESLDEEINLNFAALSETIQCSDSQLLDALESIQALKISGQYRLLGLELKLKLIGQTMTFMEQNDVPATSLKRVALLEKLIEEERAEVVEHFLTMYFLEDEEGILSFREKEVCQLFAEGLLTSTSRFALADFCRVWQAAVPAGLQTSLEQLAGMVLIEQGTVGSYIKLFPEHDLPEDVSERLAILFRARKKWSLLELAPYIQPLASANQDANAILTKYARGSNENGVKYFSAKHV